MTDSVSCLVKIIEKDEGIIAAVQFEVKLFDFFYQSKQLTDYIYTDICCKLSKCIGQTPCSYEHYLVSSTVSWKSGGTENARFIWRGMRIHIGISLEKLFHSRN